LLTLVELVRLVQGLLLLLTEFHNRARHQKEPELGIILEDVQMKME